MARPRISLATLALAGFVLAGGVACSNSGNTTPASDSTPTSGSTLATSVESSAVSPNLEAPAALQFSAPLVGGGTIDFSQYAGQTVALWFWAPT